MMKHITSFKSLLSMMVMLVMGNITAAADNKVYISDFSIAADEEVEIAINFDTDATDIRGIDGTIVLPAGLNVVENAYGANQLTKADETRAAGFLNNFKPSNGYFKFRGMLSSNVITGTTGAVAYFKVKAGATLGATSIIKLSDFEIEHADGTKEAATMENAVVTCTSAALGANFLSADPAEIGLAAGTTAEFAVNLTNEAAFTGFEAVIDLPAGVTAELTKSARLTGAIFNYNPTTKKVTYWGAAAITGNEGAIFTVKLTADNTFTLPAKVTLSDINFTNASSVVTGLDPVVIHFVEADPFAALVKKAIENAVDGLATVTLDKDYAVKSPIELPAGISLVLDGAGNSLTLGENTNFTVANDIIIKNVNIDATALKGNFVELAVMNEPEAWVENNVKFDAVNVKGLKKALFYSAGKNFLVKEFIVNNSVIEQAGDATTFDFTKGSAAEKFEISNSTIYALTATSKSLYSSQGGQKVIDAGADLTQTFSLQNSTFYNLAKSKNFFSHRQSNQKWLIYDVKNNIFVDCGKSGQVIKGLNGGQSGKNPTWIVENNAFTFDGVSTAAEESTGDADEPVKNSIIEAVKFADVANADFHVEASSMVAREKTGDARWLIPYVAPTLNTNGLLLEINKATRVIELATADEAPEALKALKDELEKAEELFADPVGKVQAEIDIETKALKAAREAYAMAVVKNALDKEIAAATELLGTNPTDVDPGKALNDAIEAAKTVSAKADATAEEVVAATEALKAAEEAYTMAVVKNALDKEIAAATELLGTNPTDVDPGKALNDAIEAAKTVSAKADATAEEVVAATEALKAAEEAYNTATAGIVGVKADDFTKDGAVYDLNGVRVMNPTKGLYIKNGKKYIVK